MLAPSVGLGVLFCHPLRCSAQFRQSKAQLEIAGILQGCRLVSTRHARRDHDAGAKRTVQHAEWVNLRALPRETAVLHAHTSTISEIGLTTDWRSCFESTNTVDEATANSAGGKGAL